MTSDLSQIIAHAKKLHARNQTLEIGVERRDKDIAELREALVKERRRFHRMDFFFGVAIGAFVAFVIANAIVKHYGY